MWRSEVGADGADSGCAFVRVLLRDVLGQPSVILDHGAQSITAGSGACGHDPCHADGGVVRWWTWRQDSFGSWDGPAF